MSEPIRVDVWSDIACPWCFVGKRRFAKGVEQAGVDVTVEYHSYELAPDTPVDFEGSEVDFLARHKGMAKDDVERMLAQMTELAAAEGLAYDFSAVRHTKTLRAHELLHHAKAQGRQLDLVERLFSAYFEEGRHVGHVDDLVELAAEAGLDPDAARQALEEGTYADAVQADVARARAYGISGVPFYVVDGRYGVPGAQSPETFAQALRQVDEERRAEAADSTP